MNGRFSLGLFFCALVPVAASCGGSDSKPAVATGTLPGVALSVDGNEMRAFGSAPIQRAAIIRYDFTGSSPAVANAECSSALVDGDPLHWTVSCPAHPYLSPEEEFVVDANGNLLFHRDKWAATYTNPAERPGWTVTEVDAAGMPLHATISVADWLDPRTDQPIPGTGNETATWAYDAHERLVHLEFAVVGIAPPYLTIDIAYDDASRRITYQSIVDDAAIFGDGGGPGVNGGYDLFDENLQRVESYWFRPGGDEFSDTYSYDDQGRLATHIAHQVYWGGAGGTREYVERRIYP